MSSNILNMMIGISTFLGFLGLIALIWGLKSGQFDDREKFLEATKYDDEESLRDAATMQKRKEAKKDRKKRYSPPD
jgi:cbb3-type cytochrome oxidase maturation protein